MESNDKISLFVLVGFIVVVILVFTGAGGLNDPQVGRYRMTVTTRNNFTDIYVIDTTTGIVKYLGKDEGKPFDKISGK